MHKIRIFIILASAMAGANLIPAQHLSPTPRKEVKDTIAVDSVFISLISLIGSTPEIPDTPAIQNQEPTDTFPLSVLDYLSSAYEESDFYSSGNSRSSPKEFVDPSKFTAYSGTLPSYFHTDFQCPIPRCIITSRFGLRDDGKKMHKGIDLSLHRGDTIVAALPGKVHRVGYEKNGYGYFVIINHPDGYQTRYAHLQKPIIKPDTIIEAGTPIAIGGTSGNSSGPHLHFEIRCNGAPVDPTILLKKGWSKSK